MKKFLGYLFILFLTFWFAWWHGRTHELRRLSAAWQQLSARSNEVEAFQLKALDAQKAAEQAQLSATNSPGSFDRLIIGMWDTGCSNITLSGQRGGAQFKMQIAPDNFDVEITPTRRTLKF